jgi:putative lipoprotein
MMAPETVLLRAGIVTLLLGWNAGGQEAKVVTGTATYRERIALPPEAVFEATLEDVSRLDAPADVIGRTRLESPGQPPFRFSIKYDPARIQESRMYAVRARVTAGDRLMFFTNRSYPVLTRGNGTEVTMLLRRAGRERTDQPI